MAILQGSVVAKVAIAVVGLGAGAFGAINYASTGCVLEACSSSGDASLTLASNSGDEARQCPVTGAETSSNTQLVSASSNENAAGSCALSCSTDKAELVAVSNEADTCSTAKTCSTDKAELVAVSNEADTCSTAKTCSTDKAELVAVNNEGKQGICGVKTTVCPVEATRVVSAAMANFMRSSVEPSAIAGG